MNNLIKIMSGNLSRITKLMFVLALFSISIKSMAQQKSSASETTSNSIKSENKLRDFYRSYIAAANSRDFDAIADVVAEDVMLNGKMVKREDIIAQFKILLKAIPDFKWNLKQLVVDGEDIAARLRDSGTPEANTFFGDNPKRNTVEFTEFGSYKVRNGLFVEMWFLIDVTAIAEQFKINAQTKHDQLKATSTSKVEEEPIEVINRWFSRFKAGASAEELASFWAEDAVMWIPGDTQNIPWVGKRVGRADIAAHYKVLWKNIKSESLVISDMLSKGNRVVVLGHLKSTYLGNNKLIDSDFSMNIIVENGLIKSYYFLEDSFEVAEKIKGTKPKL